MRQVMLRVVGALLLTAVLFTVTGCEELLEPGGRKPAREQPPEPEPPEPEQPSAPTFTQTRIEDQRYIVGTAIAPVTLPAATGGNGTLRYSLSAVPGLSFNPATRVLTGTPTEKGAYDMAYTVTDADGDRHTLSFHITATAVFVVDRQAAEDIASVSNDSVTFSQPAGYTEGDFIVSGVTDETPQGMLREVTAVSGDRMTATTRPATLEDVVTDGRLTHRGQLLPSALTPESRQALADAGIILDASRNLQTSAVGEIFDFTLRYPNIAFSAGDYAMMLTGSISFSLSYEVDVEYKRGRIRSAIFTVTPEVSENLRVSFAASTAIPSGIKKIGDLEWTIVPPGLQFTPITVPIGLLPVIFTPTFVIKMGVSGTGEVTFDVTRSGAVTVGIECERDCSERRNWNRVVDPDVDMTINEVSIGAELKAYIRPELGLKLYGVVGPVAGVELYGAAGGIGGILDGRFDAYAYVDVGASASLGIRLEIPDAVPILGGHTLLSISAFEGIELFRERLWEWRDRRPTFGSEFMGDQVYPAGQPINNLRLPRAMDGDPPLTYRLEPVPPGLRFNDGTRILSGRPTQAGAYSMSYTATDADGDTAYLPRFTIRVEDPLSWSRSVSDQNQTYTEGRRISTLRLPAASGGRSPLRYSLTPTVPGLSFNASERSLAGTPTQAGTYPMTYRVTDANGATASQQFRIVVERAVAALSFGTGRVGDQTYTAGTAISKLWLPAASGGRSPLTYSLTPTVPGLSFNASERSLAGTPTRPGTYSMTYRVTDTRGAAASQQFRIVVERAVAALSFGTARVGDQTYTAGTAISKLWLPTASGGRSPLTYSLTPTVPGLRFNASERSLTGTPTSPGTYLMTYWVTDARGAAASLQFRIVVERAVAVLSFGAAGVGDQTYTAGTAISKLWLPVASGGRSPLRYSLTPTVPGLSFSASERSLAGTPTRAGTYSMRYWVTDASDGAAELRFTIYVVERAVEAMNFGTARVGNQTYTAGTAISKLWLPAASGGRSPLTYSLTPTVPGLSFNARERSLTGTPTQAGTYSMTYRATDTDSAVASLSFTVTVQRRSSPTPPTGPKIYWADRNTGKIQRADLSGSNVEDLVTTGISDPKGIAVHNGKMYWTDQGADNIRRANLDGSGVEVLVSLGPSNRSPEGIVIHNGKIYWTDWDRIQRANLDGSGIEDLITAGIGVATGMTIHNNKMYWTDTYANKIQRANLDGSGIEDIVTGLLGPVGITIHNAKMYWTDADPSDSSPPVAADTIRRANLDGSGVEILVEYSDTPLYYVRGIAIHNSKMYWANAGVGKIQRANLDGSNIETLITGLGFAFAIAIVP